MKIQHHSFFSLCITLICALFINTVIAGPVEDGGTLTCSTDTALANINDIRFSGTGLTGGELTYLEVYILEQNVDVSNWQLCYTYPGNKQDCIQLGQGDFNEYFYGNPQGDDASPDAFNTGTYLEFPVPNNQTLAPTDGEVLLVNNINGVDVVIDYIQYCNSATCGTPNWDVPIKTSVDANTNTSTTVDANGCGFLVTNHSSDNKDLARLPDATGDFGDNGDDVTRGDTNDDSPPTPLFGFTFDEPFWDGTTGEVLDTQGSASGNAEGNATTSSASPAVPGSPGTCGYGVFDGSGDYVTVGTLPSGGGEENEIEIESPSLTFTAWIQTRDDAATQTIFSFGNDLNLTLSATGKLTLESNQLNPGTLSSADGVIENNTWYFVSLVINPADNDILLYTATQTGSLTLVASELNFSLSGSEFEIEIEDAGDLTIGGGSGLSSFNGFIDEPALFGGPLSSTKLDEIKANVRPCAVSAPNHYSITHDGSGLSCLAEAITITAHDSSATLPHGLVNVSAGTAISLNAIDTATTTAHGTWSTIQSGTGSLTNNTAGTGTATYTFPGGESSVTLLFNYTNPVSPTDTVNFDLIDGDGTTELKDTSLVNEDPDLQFGTAGFIFNNDTNGDQTIPTQISGKDSNIAPADKILTIQAVKVSTTDPAQCEALFMNQTVAIELGAECRNPLTCIAGQQLSINGTDIPTNNDDGVSNTTTTNYSNPAINLAFNALSKAPLVINYPDAGLMQLHARYNIPLDNGTLSGNYMYGNSNDFVVRPFAYRLAVAGNPGVTTVTEGSGIFRDAGENFDIALAAVAWEQADDMDNNGVPDNYTYTTPATFSDLLALNNITPNFGNEVSAATANLSPTVVAPVGGVDGNLSATTASFTNGESTMTTSWDEVGAMTTLALTSDYLGGGEEVRGITAEIGRFHPAQYEISSPSVTEACVNFTYSRQAFNESISIEAQNTSGSPTRNYRGDFATIDINNTDELPVRNDQTGIAYDTHSATFINNFSTSLFGEAMLDIDLTWNMPEQAETTSTVQVLTSSTDDGVINIVPGGMPDLNDLGSAQIRFGRLTLSNAFGSELLPLNMPVRTEYYDGTSYILNTDDNCTSIIDTPLDVPAPNTTIWGDIELPVASYTGNLSQGETIPNIAGPMFAAGTDMLTLSSAGAGNDGSVTINLNVPVWLQFDWDGDGTHDNDPSATATFGIFHGNDATIYRRELY